MSQDAGNPCMHLSTFPLNKVSRRHVQSSGVHSALCSLLGRITARKKCSFHKGSKQRGSFECMATFAYMSEFGDAEPVYIEAFDGQLRCYRARFCFSRAIMSCVQTHIANMHARISAIVPCNFYTTATGSTACRRGAFV